MMLGRDAQVSRPQGNMKFFFGGSGVGQAKIFRVNQTHGIYNKIFSQKTSKKFRKKIQKIAVLFHSAKNPIFSEKTPDIQEKYSKFSRKIPKNFDNILDFRFQRHIYEYLLQRYLLLKYRTESEAKSKYCRLMNAIELLHVLWTKTRQMHVEENFIDRQRIFKMFEELGI